MVQNAIVKINIVSVIKKAKKRGRPTKYNPEVMIPAIEEYLEPFRTGMVNELPSRYKYARAIGVNQDTVVEWDKIHEDFSVALKEIDAVQAQQLKDHGMYGGKEVNTTMAIFLLKANHGLIETERKQVVGADNEEIKIRLVEPRHNEEE